MDGKNRCRYFDLCPLRRLEKSAEIDEDYRKRFCELDFEKCVRFKMEGRGIPHPDRLMPDGSMLVED